MNKQTAELELPKFDLIESDDTKPTAEWRVHTPRLLDEALKNKGAETLRIPICILGRILANVGERAIEINDPELNKLMIQLTIYTVADPYSDDYDPETVEKYMKGDWPTEPQDTL